MIGLIDKRELQDEFAKECRGDCGICPHEVWGTCNLINMMPTVEVKPVVYGKWILEERAGVDYWCCSECHKIKSEYYAKPTDNFCGNCGCDMRTSAE